MAHRWSILGALGGKILGTKRPKFDAEDAVLENFGDILEKLRNFLKFVKKRFIRCPFITLKQENTIKFPTSLIEPLMLVFLVLPPLQ